MRIPDYPAPARTVEATDVIAGWVDGQQVAMSMADLPFPSLSDFAGMEQVVQRLSYGASGGILVSGLTVTPAIAEVGQIIGSVHLAWAVTGATPTAQALTINGTASAVPAANRAVDPAGLVITQAATFAITAIDATAPAGADGTSTASVTLPFLHRRFWGGAAAAALDGAGVVALANSELSDARAKTVTIDGGSGAGLYLYYAWPASEGDPSAYRIFGFDETPALATVTVTTAAGATLAYRVARSPNPLTGPAPVEIG